eukprot:jgi/Chrzof1/9171/Cz03g38180.t1
MLGTAVNPSRCSFAAGSFKPARVQNVRRAAVITHVKPTKAADFKGLDNAEIIQKIAELKKEHFRIEYFARTRGATLFPGNQEDQETAAKKQPKAHEFKHVRRQIAQLWTILRERQAADGITRKQAKQLKREVVVEGQFGNLAQF